MKIALIGCGVIGRAITKAVRDGIIKASLSCLYDTDRARSRELSNILHPKLRICRDIKEILASDAELVVEAASQKAVMDYASQVLKAGKSLLIMSVGALLDEKLYNTLEGIAEERGVKIYLPSGAIGGLDAMRGASIGKIFEVKLVTTKHPRALAGAPYLVRKGINIRDIDKKTVIYEGSALEAVKEFPANINVSAALSLAGIGAAKTMVIIVADPGVECNIHEVTAKGDIGSFTMRFENLPSPENTRTSFLAALSAIATLKRLSSPVEVGT
ncbi:MAG: aspartate dehydrogenase [Candidatus Hydrothermarchaeota archaeon]|nr:aspartate dehydrogenase [Candidatus Hydrothermarchaeota archaeon]